MKKEKAIWLYKFLYRNNDAKVALTLTLKKVLKHENGAIEHLSRDKASQNVRHFLNLLNRQLYGNKWKKINRLKVVSVIEDGAAFGLDKRIHVHLAVSFPLGWNFEHLFEHLKYRALIEDCWCRTRWGYSEFRYVPADDQRGWLRYLIKEGPESVDLLNCHW